MKRFAYAIILLGVAAGSAGCSRCDQSVAEKQRSMVERQIRFRGISDKRILKVMREVPRANFVLAEYKHLAYEDTRPPIGKGQTLDRPYEDALILDTLKLQPSDRVLEVGTGSGYLAALMAKLADEVYTIEILPDVAQKARENLTKLGVENVHVKTGDGFLGWEEHAPFDAIVLTASPTTIPEPLKKQLADGGRILLPLGGAERFQELLLYVKQKGRITLDRRVAPASFVPMKGIVEDK